MQTLYRLATDSVQEAPAASPVPLADSTFGGRPGRVTLREVLDAFLRSVMSARAGYGD